MTRATYDAIVTVDKILHDAGWDESDDSLSEASQQLERISRTSYWGELSRTIKDYYRLASQGIDESSPKRPF